MDEFVWSEDLATGEKIVDFQHKKIFTYLNILIVAANDKETQRHTLKNIIDALIEYTVLHFEDEEIVLESIGYPDLKKHKKIHAECSRQVLDFKKRFEMGEVVIDELILFIKNWVLEHIKKEDAMALRYKRHS